MWHYAIYYHFLLLLPLTSNIWPLKPADRGVFIAGFALFFQADAQHVAIIAAAPVTPNADFQPLKVAPAKAD